MDLKVRKTKGKPDPVDIHVGKRLRIRRSLLGVSQEKLANEIGLTFQQVQKYERGTNRISAGRLYKFSKVLDVPIDYFYEQLETAVTRPISNVNAGFADNEQAPFISEDILQQKETLDLIRIYYTIKDVDTRKDIVKFIKSMAKSIDWD